jgi:hypothetical protein
MERRNVMPYGKNRSLQLRRTLLMLVTGLIVFGLVLPPNSKASEWDHKVFLTFNTNVRIPGVVLGAGTYTVKRAAPNQPLPDILQFSNRNETVVYATVIAIPVKRARPTGKVVVTFYETKGLTPPAVEALYYPGDITGEQFIYPKGGPVLMALAGEKVMETPPPAEPAPAISESEPPAEPMAAATPEPAPAEPENNQMAEAIPPTPPPQEEQKELPKTSSNLPLLGLLGVVALVAGTGLKSFAKTE